jgi:homospermidine synthase
MSEQSLVIPAQKIRVKVSDKKSLVLDLAENGSLELAKTTVIYISEKDKDEQEDYVKLTLEAKVKEFEIKEEK